MVVDKKLFPKGKQDISREEKSKMKWRMLFVIMFFICVVGFLILTATIFFLKVSPRELFLRCVFAGYVLTQKPPPMPPPSDVFRQYVVDPIPNSVTNIKADKPKDIWG